MSYTVPPVAASTTQLTAALWNTYIRDNLEALAKKPSFSAYRVGNIPISGGGLVTWSNLEVDRGMAIPVAGGYKEFQVQQDGWYSVAGCIPLRHFTDAAIGQLYVELQVYDPTPFASYTVPVYTHAFPIGLFLFQTTAAFDLTLYLTTAKKISVYVACFGSSGSNYPDVRDAATFSATLVSQ